MFHTNGSYWMFLHTNVLYAMSKEVNFKHQILINSHKAEPLMVDNSSVTSVPKLPSNTNTPTVTTPSISETLYSSLSNPMTTTVRKWECTLN